MFWGKRRLIEISVDRDPRRIEIPSAEAFTSGVCESHLRGKPRLAIDVPGPSGSLGFSGILMGLMGFAGTVHFLVSTDQSPCAFALVLLPLAILLSGVYFVYRHYTVREVLEIDSRFVTVTRAGRLAGVFTREQFADVRMNPDVPPDLKYQVPIPLPLPTIIWGTDSDDGTPYMAGSASGIPYETGEVLLDEIREFLDEHPPEPGFEYRAGAFPPGAHQR